MAANFRQSYTRLGSNTDVTDKVGAGTAIYDLQETPLVPLDPSTSRRLSIEDTKYDPAGPVSRLPRGGKWHRYRLTGWRVGAGIAMAGALVTLLCNIGAAVYGIKHRISGSSHSSELIEIFHGDCKKSASINTYVHLLINVVSTLLLSGSNYCMQCVVAPTRKDVDTAHAKMKWLDIGVPSIRNLKHINGSRRVLWALLIISSLPLHLMFNSVFFTSIATNDYNVIFATEGFTTGANFSTANGFNTAAFQPPFYKEDLQQVQRDVQLGRFERLENADCLKSYAVDLVTDRRTLIVVSSNVSKHDNGAVLGSGNQEYVTPEHWYVLAEGYDPYTWLCSERDAAAVKFNPNPSGGSYPYCYKYVDRLIADPAAWAPSDWTPEYCLSEKVDGQCSCYLNLTILWIVIACNVIKMVIMATVAFSTALDQPLCTIGDAIASFVTNPDPTTENMCLVTRNYMVIYEESLRSSQVYRQEKFSQDPDLRHFIAGFNGWTPPGPQKWHTERKLHWYQAPSSLRWWWACIFFIACLLTTIGLLGRAVNAYAGDASISALASLGLGHPNSQTMIDGWAISSMSNKTAAIVLSVLVANTPQIVLSFLYFSVNGICTCMGLASEWGRFSYANALRNGPKTLRTSEPCGKQRSTYFLQLPFRFAIPLIVVSALLHWLISQSIFVAVVTIYDELGGLKEEFAVTTCGFSPFAMILVIFAGTVLAGGIAGIGWFRLEPGMRVVGSSSAAISAACHVGQKTAGNRWDLIKGPIVWGDVGVGMNEAATTFTREPDSEVRHCTFAGATETGWKDAVEAPREGTKYT